MHARGSGWRSEVGQSGQRRLAAGWLGEAAPDAAGETGRVSVGRALRPDVVDDREMDSGPRGEAPELVQRSRGGLGDGPTASLSFRDDQSGRRPPAGARRPDERQPRGPVDQLDLGETCTTKNSCPDVPPASQEILVVELLQAHLEPFLLQAYADGRRGQRIWRTMFYRTCHTARGC